MRIISSPVFQLRDIIRALLTSSSSSDFLSTLFTYGQSLGASTIHGYLVDRSYETQTLINEEFSSYQGRALCIHYDLTLTEQQWEEIFGIHEANSVVSRTASSLFHLTDFLCILSGSRVVFYDPNERIVQDERAYVSIFDLEHDEIDMFQDQFSPLDFFLRQSKTFYNGTLIRLPLRTNSPSSISSRIPTFDQIEAQIFEYFSSTNSFIELLLSQTNLNRIQFDYTKDFHEFQRFFSIEKQSLTTIRDVQSTTEYLHLNVTKTKENQETNETTRWLLSIYTDFNETYQCKIDLKLLLPLNESVHSICSNSFHYNSMQINPTRILYYSVLPSLNILPKSDLANQLCQMKFPHAYALFLKDLSRLIKPTTTASNLSIDLIWQLMPDIDEHQRLFNEIDKYPLEQQMNIQIIHQLIADIWSEIGKQELFYSVTDGWGYVAIEDMIINNVQAGPIQDVLTYVFSEANAPIVILPPHVINGLCKYSNKHYLQVMTPFHASELLAKNSLILSRLTAEQKLSLLKYILYNDPDPGLVLELDLLPLANQQFATFRTKTSPTIFLMNNRVEFLSLFSQRHYDRFVNPQVDANLFEILSSKTFQGNHFLFFPLFLQTPVEEIHLMSDVLFLPENRCFFSFCSSFGRARTTEVFFFCYGFKRAASIANRTRAEKEEEEEKEERKKREKNVLAEQTERRRPQVVPRTTTTIAVGARVLFFFAHCFSNIYFDLSPIRR